MPSTDASTLKVRRAEPDALTRDLFREWEAVARISPARLHGDPKIAWWRLRQLLPPGQRTLVRNYRELSRDLDVSESSVRRALHSLQIVELIAIDRLHGPDGKPLKGGRLSIELADPLELAGPETTSRPAVTIDEDPQACLFGDLPQEGGRAPRLATPCIPPDPSTDPVGRTPDAPPHPAPDASTDAAQQTPEDAPSRPLAGIPPDPSTDPVEPTSDVPPHPAPDASTDPSTDAARRPGESLSHAFARITRGNGHCHSPKETKERTTRNLPKYQRTKDQGSYPGKPQGFTLVRTERAGSVDGCGATQATAGSGMEAAPVGQAIAAAAQAFARPAYREARKRDLELEILTAVGDLANRSLAGRFADLVVYCGMPHEHLHRVLIDVREMRRAGTIRIGNGGALFNAMSHRIGSRWCRSCRQRLGQECPLGINYLKRKEPLRHDPSHETPPTETAQRPGASVVGDADS